MAQGRVKWFNDQKGFGFIAPEDKTADVFVHHSQIVSEARFRTLAENDLVEYDVKETDKGLRAMNVRRLPARG